MNNTNFKTSQMHSGFIPNLSTAAHHGDERGWARAYKGFRPVSSDETFEKETKPLIEMLMIGDDLELAESRLPILRACGFSVRSCVSRDLNRCGISRPRVILFCHTVQAAHASRIASLLRSEDFGVMLVRLSRTPLMEEPVYDKILAAPLSPGSLMGEMLKLHLTSLREHEHRR